MENFMKKIGSKIKIKEFSKKDVLTRKKINYRIKVTK